MSAYIIADCRSDVVSVVWRPELDRVCITVGTGALHVTPDTARQLAGDILAALESPVEGAA